MNLLDRVWSLFSAKPQAAEDFIATQPVGVPFPWHAGITMTPLSNVVIALPTAILDANTHIGDIINCDDAAEISIPPATDTDAARVLLRLRSGMSVTLRRSAQAVVLSADPSPPPIRVSGVAAVQSRLSKAQRP
ncbi:MAG: hypothetical protein ACREJO_18845 [Phycisphaerales bacterium]